MPLREQWDALGKEFVPDHRIPIWRQDQSSQASIAPLAGQPVTDCSEPSTFIARPSCRLGSIAPQTVPPAKCSQPK